MFCRVWVDLSVGIRQHTRGIRVNTRGTKDLDDLAELVIHSTHDLSNELSLY